MTTKKPAGAGRKTVAKATSTPTVVEGVQLIRLPLEANKPSNPVAMFKGIAPSEGETIEFTLEDGITRRGVVSEATEADGEVMAEFAAPLVVVPKE